MRINWSDRATSDLRELVATIVAEDSIEEAELVAERILNAAELRSKTPRGARIGRVPGTREKVVSRTPYILIYRIAPEGARILRVYHGKREWPAKF